MNLALIRPQASPAVARLASDWTPLGLRIASPPRRLLTLAGRLPQSWPKRLIDLGDRRLDVKELGSFDAAVLDRSLGAGVASRRIARACVRAAVRLLTPQERLTAEVASATEQDQDDALPMWDLADFSSYRTIVVPASSKPRSSQEPAPGSHSFGGRFRSPGSVADEIRLLRRSGWEGPIHLSTPGAGWSCEAGGQLLQFLARRRADQETHRLRTELTLEDACAPEIVKNLTAAGIKDVALVIHLGSTLHSSLRSSDSFIQTLIWLQRQGIQVRSAVLVKSPAASWNGFARTAAELVRAGVDQTLRQLLRIPIGEKYLAVAVRAARTARISLSELAGATARLIGSLRMRPGTLPLLTTSAIYSELQRIGDAAC